MTSPPIARSAQRHGDADVDVVAPYEDLSALLYDQISPKDWDEKDYLALASGIEGEILELGCGTGRILLRLAEAAHQVVGLERAPQMLDVLRKRLSRSPHAVRERVELVHADATTFDLGRRFELILLPYFTLGMLEDSKAMLARVREHLADGGSFAFDFPTVLDPNARSLSGETIEHVHRLDGRIVRGTYGTRYDAAERSIVAQCRWDLDGAARPAVETKTIATFEAQEVDRLLDAAGLVVVQQRTELLEDRSMRRTLLRCQTRTARRRPLWHPYQPHDHDGQRTLTLVQGCGCEVVDDAGRRYLDASGGLWSVQCGLGRREIVDAVTRQLERLSYATLFCGRGNDVPLELARQLVTLAPAPLEWVYLTGSGSESVELAMKLARLFHVLDGHPKKKGILYLDASYHGTFFGSMGVTALVDVKEAFAPLLPGVSCVPAPLPATCPPGMSYAEHTARCAAVLETMLAHAGSRVAALILEPVLGSGGIVVLPRAYVERVQRACRAHDVLLIADEVATGFGRTGLWFACEHLDMRPDLMLLSKGISSGYLPLGAVLFSARIGEALISSGAAIGHGSSHNGNPACCAAGLATLELMRRDGLVERSALMGRLFLERLEALQGAPGLGAVRGLGLMVFAGLINGQGHPATPAGVLSVLAGMQRRGVLGYPAADGLAFLPALTITAEQVERIVSCLAAVLDEAAPA